MITEAFFNLVFVILNGILNLLEILPEFPETFVNSIDSYFNLIFSNISLLSFFVRIDTLKIIVPLFIAVYNFEYLYKFIMWIIRKVPLSIE